MWTLIVKMWMVGVAVGGGGGTVNLPDTKLTTQSEAECNHMGQELMANIERVHDSREHIIYYCVKKR